MMYREKFLNQMQLLLQCLPAIRDQERFAIKGGVDSSQNPLKNGGEFKYKNIIQLN